MALETFSYITSLDANNPVTTDQKKQGDDHLRGLKSTLLASFPAVAGAVTVSHLQLNEVVNKAPLASPPLTGTPTGPTAAAGANTTQLATTEFVTTAAAALVAGTLVDSLVKKGKIMFYAG